MRITGSVADGMRSDQQGPTSLDNPDEPTAQRGSRTVRLSRVAYEWPLVSAYRRDAAVTAAPTDFVARYKPWRMLDTVSSHADRRPTMTKQARASGLLCLARELASADDAAGPAPRPVALGDSAGHQSAVGHRRRERIGLCRPSDSRADGAGWRQSGGPQHHRVTGSLRY